MRAVLCDQFEGIDGLRVGEKADPLPGPGEVVIHVRAASVQFVDIKIVEGKSLLNTKQLDDHFGRKIQLDLPLTPGMEASGVIVAVGEGVTGFKIGDRVLGTALAGAWAEKMRLDASEIWPIPDEMDFVTAGAFYVLYFTAAYSLLKRGQLVAGETVLVLGAGSGAGLAAVELAKAQGAFVIAAASSEKKLASARERGADALVHYPEQIADIVAGKALTAAFRKAADGREIEVVADFVGGAYAEPAMRAMAFKARFLSIGFAAGIPAVPMHVIFNKNAQLIGCEPVADGRLPGENRELVERLFDLWRAGQLAPLIMRTFPLDGVKDALSLLDRRQSIGRVMLTPNDPASIAA